MPINYGIDSPCVYSGNRIICRSRTLHFLGWAFGDGNTCSITVLLDGKPYAAELTANLPRGDVALAFSEYPYSNQSGFKVTVTFLDDFDHDIAIKFECSGDAHQVTSRVLRNPPEDVNYIESTDIEKIYYFLCQKNPSVGSVNTIMRLGAGMNFSRADYIDHITCLPDFKQTRSTESVFERFVDIDFMGAKMRLPEFDHITKSVRNSGSYEPYVMDYLLSELRPGSVFLDIGANMGLFSIPAALIVGSKGSVFAIEALSRNAKIILINAELNDLQNVHVIPIGASETVGANYWVKQDSSSNNSISEIPRLKNLAFNDFDLIGVAPLDRLLGDTQQVDVIKIDIEGREYRAFLGTMKTIKRCRPVIFCEYNPLAQKEQSDVDGSELLLLLINENYDVEILHRSKARNKIAGEPQEIVALINEEWRRHQEDENGTHLDLCFSPKTVFQT